MKPAPFEYVVAESTQEAVAQLARFDGDARCLAGGQSLVPLLNMRLLRPAAVVDLNRVPGLDGIDAPPGRLRHVVLGEAYYLVPRRDGLVLAGSTVLVWLGWPVVALLAGLFGGLGGSLAVLGECYAAAIIASVPAQRNRSPSGVR